MAGDKTKIDARGRARVAGFQDYKVQMFAQEHGISIEQARSLIEKFGADRQVLDREAWMLVH